MTVTINGTTGLAGTNGSAGTPAVQGEDTNTGIFFPAADTVAVATAGAERLRVDSSGNLGLGVTPSAWTTSGPKVLDIGTRGALVDWSSAQQTDIWSNGYFNGTNSIYKTTANASIYRQASGQHQWFTAPSGTAGNAITFTQAMTLDASGNLLVGTTDPGTDYVRFACNGQTRNQLGLISLDNIGNNGFVMFRTSNGTLIGSISRNGSTSAVLYSTTSDYRLKESVADLSDGLSRVMALRPVSWVWKDCDGETGEGFIAHEVQDVVPAAVSGEKDAVEADGSIKAQGMDASYLVATLVKAIQEQQALITDLTARIAILEAK